MESPNQEKQPDWISIYFEKLSKDEMKCNLCEVILKVDEQSLDLFDHLTKHHRDIYELHKDNSEATVGFRIEFLNINMLKDDGDPKTQPIILGEVCEATTTETSEFDNITQSIVQKDDEIILEKDAILINKESGIVIKNADNDMQYVIYDDTKKKQKRVNSASRKRSWVWKYFDKLSNIIYRCRLCSVVLSIKGCNSNNMNRHIRTRHPIVFRAEVTKREKADDCYLVTSDGTPYTVKTEEIYTNDKEYADMPESPTQKLRRSWIWSYFVRVSHTQAQCKLCKRHICHGGNATGNMNRHLRMIHKKTAFSYNQSWIWKVFEDAEPDGIYSCKICQFTFTRDNDNDLEKDMNTILDHLKMEHGVISGDQIITGSEGEAEAESAIALIEHMV